MNHKLIADNIAETQKNLQTPSPYETDKTCENPYHKSARKSRKFNQNRKFLNKSRTGGLNAQTGTRRQRERKKHTFLTKIKLAAAMAATTPPRMVTGPVRRLHLRWIIFFFFLLLLPLSGFSFSQMKAI